MFWRPIMDKIIYTNSLGELCVVIPVPKEAIERVIGKLTDQEYEAHVIERSIPVDAVGVRYVKESDIPESREFRNAWCDTTTDSTIDISLEKARDIKLAELRASRDVELEKTDVLMTRALEDGDPAVIDEVKATRQALRDLTDPIKDLTIEPGAVNDTDILDQLTALAIVPDDLKV